MDIKIVDEDVVYIDFGEDEMGISIKGLSRQLEKEEVEFLAKDHDIFNMNQMNQPDKKRFLCDLVGVSYHTPNPILLGLLTKELYGVR